MENKKWSMAGALVSAVAASACCLGPLIFAGLGLGGLGAFAFLEKYRPIFTAVTLTFLAAGFYFTYRKREEVCEDGSCRVCSASPKAKALLWIATIAAVGVLSSPRWLPAVMDGHNHAKSLGGSAAQNLQTVPLTIGGMDCAMCAVGIEKELRKVPGVVSAKVHFDQKTALVRGNGLKSKALIAAVKKAGYVASIKKEK